MAESEGEGGEAAKSVAEVLFGTLGIVDVVLGAVALYAGFVAFPSPIKELEETGSEFVKAALLFCVAALAGKVILLLASVLAAIFRGKQQRKTLSTLVLEYEALHQIRTDLLAGVRDKKDAGLLHDAEDRALAYLEYERAIAAKRCTVVRDNAVCAYGASVVVIVVVALFFVDHPAILFVLIAAALLMVFGRLTYEDFVRQLYLSLRGYVSKANAKSEAARGGQRDEFGYHGYIVGD